MNDAHNLAAELLQLADENRTSMVSEVSRRLRAIAARLTAPATNGRKKGPKKA